MPDYKRKKVNRFFKNKPKHKKAEEKIVMDNKKSSKRSILPQDKIKIVRGNKFIRQQRTRFVAGFAVIVCIVLLILSVSMPGGLYENVVNYTAMLGHGSYPVSVSGGTVIDSVSGGSYYYVLTDTNIAAYSNSGKILFDELHGFANPVMKVSATRVMVYDQGGKLLYLYNLGGKIDTLDAQNEILAAAISDDGKIAVSTHASNAFLATVYNKNLKQIYQWTSPNEIISDVLLHSSGKKMAVSTLNVVSGQYSSKVHIIKFNKESADPIHTLDLGTSLPLSISNNGKGISIVCNDKYKFLHWAKFTTKEIALSGEINICRNTSNGMLLVFNLANNRNDNTIVLVSKKGTISSEFKTQGLVTDIQYNKGRVYLLSDTTVTIYNKKGKLLRYDETEYGTKKFAVTSSNAIAAISDNKIVKTNIDKG